MSGGSVDAAGPRLRLPGPLARAVISLAILAALLWWLSAGEVLAQVRRIPALVWAAVVALFLVGHAVSALKWRMLIGAAGARLAVLPALRAHGAGLFANLCLPSIVGGDVVRAGVAVAKAGRLEAVALGSFADRVIDTAGLVAIAGGAALLLADVEGLVGQVLVASVLLVSVGTIGAILAVALLPLERLPDAARKGGARLREALRDLLAAPGTAVGALVLSVLVQMGFVALNVMLARALGIELDARVWFLAWPLAKLMALLPVSLGGLGVREAALAALLAPFGVDAAAAVAQSLSWQAVLIFSGLLAGGAAWGLGGRFSFAPPRTEQAS